MKNWDKINNDFYSCKGPWKKRLGCSNRNWEEEQDNPSLINPGEDEDMSMLTLRGAGSVSSTQGPIAQGQHEYEEEKQERDKYHRMTQVSAATWDELQVCTAAGKVINSTDISKVVCTSWKDKENRTIHFLEMRFMRTWDFQVVLSCVWTGRCNNDPLVVSPLHASWVNFRAAGDGLKPSAKWFPRQHFYKGPGILKKCQLLLLGLSPLRSLY